MSIVQKPETFKAIKIAVRFSSMLLKDMAFKLSSFFRKYLRKIN